MRGERGPGFGRVSGVGRPDHLAPNRCEAVDEESKDNSELECEESPGRVRFDDLAASSGGAEGDERKEDSESAEEEEESFVQDSRRQVEARGLETVSVQASVPMQVELQVGLHDLTASSNEAEGVEGVESGVVSELEGE